ncbi:MAG: mannitol dehydrogenase family protein [Lachnospiraceae bacterium]|nr:mannitol dehydrogenase family protein [Lachnospiraceae bacterium]
MELTERSIINDRAAFEAFGYKLPMFDRETVRNATLKSPEWIHFGAGNIFRAFQANVLQNLLNEGIMKTGLIAAEGYDYEIIDKSYRPHDNLSILATLKADATVEKTIVGSIVESLVLDRERTEDFGRLEEIFASPSLKMASFTITEKGYAVTDASGGYTDAIRADLEAGPSGAVSYLGKVISLLYRRYTAGALPIAMVSMDNCSHNGDKLKNAVLTFAKAWCENVLPDSGFYDYVCDGTKVSFPWSMIDKITPRPDARVEKMLAQDNIAGLDPVVTTKKTWIAPFVNAEECQYLVIEDSFPAGKLPLDKAGIIYTDRETVDKVEKMKVCTCLNPLHTSLAVFGCILGYELISEEMKDPDLKKLVEKIGYIEGLPVVVNPGIIDPKSFIDEVVNVRIPNPFMPDTPQRIACDTSQKLPIRFGETIKAYASRDDLKVSDLKYIPLVFAAWLRYLMAVDDEGKAFEPSPDPLLDECRNYVSSYRLGAEEKDLSALDGLLKNDRIFGVDLCEAGMAERVKKLFSGMSSGTGAVRKTLREALQQDNG